MLSRCAQSLCTCQSPPLFPFFRTQTLSIAALVVASLLAYCTVLWVLEASCRAEAITAHRNGESPVLEMTQRKFEVSDMCYLFLGPRALIAYNVLLAVYMGFALWSYGSSSSRSLGAIIMETGITGLSCTESEIASSPLGDDCTLIYHGCLAFYGVIVVLLTLMGLKEQAWVQALFTVYQIGVLVVMVIIGITGMAKQETLQGEPIDDLEWTMAKWDGFSTLFASTVFAQIFHHSIPGICVVSFTKAEQAGQVLRLPLSMSFAVDKSSPHLTSASRLSLSQACLSPCGTSGT